MIGTIILIAVIGAVASLIVGSIWYSPATPMGRLHMKTIGFDKLSPEEQKSLIEEMKPKMWKSYLAQFVMSFLTAFFVGFITFVGMRNGETFGMVAAQAFFIWLAMMVPVIGSSILWGNTPRHIAWKKFASDAISYLVTIALVLVIAKLFV
jgi:predicted PurR-regulated permease PerM